MPEGGKTDLITKEGATRGPEGGDEDKELERGPRGQFPAVSPWPWEPPLGMGTRGQVLWAGIPRGLEPAGPNEPQR